MSAPSNLAEDLVSAVSKNAAEWGATMIHEWFDRKEAAEESLLRYIAGLEERIARRAAPLPSTVPSETQK